MVDKNTSNYEVSERQNNEKGLGDEEEKEITTFNSLGVLWNSAVNNFYCVHFGTELIHSMTVNIKPVFILLFLQTSLNIPFSLPVVWFDVTVVSDIFQPFCNQLCHYKLPASVCISKQALLNVCFIPCQVLYIYP